MATYAIAVGEIGAYEKTLAAATVDTVNFGAAVADSVEITSDGTAAIYVTLDGSAPTVAGAKTLIVPAGTGPIVRRLRANKRNTNTQVQLISPGTPKYSVAESRAAG